ncbi:matrilin-1-like [Babylonia areolata]|uniref:matrilin-1-like n=1 Tax=Babylonia areolata TaxID=304850 RepID=UPI003FD34C9F
MDLVFVVDSSTSLRPQQFDMVKQFLTEVVQGMVVSPDHIRLGLVRFSSQVDVIAYLNQSTSTERALTFIRNMAYKQGGTNTDRALRVTRLSVLTREGGERAGVADVVVVVTDGRSWFPRRTAREAQLLRDRHVEIIVLGIGENLLMSELRSMTSGVVRVIKDFESLQGLVGEMRANVCTGF